MKTKTFLVLLATAAVAENERCVSIDSTSACAPWSSGLRVNLDELSLVYNRNLSSAQDWQEMVQGATSGGDLMRQQWVEFAGCPGYHGEAIQFARVLQLLNSRLMPV